MSGRQPDLVFLSILSESGTDLGQTANSNPI